MRRTYSTGQLFEGLADKMRDGVYSEELEYLGNDFRKYLTLGNTIYLINQNRVCRINHSTQQVRMQEMTHANKRGKSAPQVAFTWRYSDNDSEGYNFFDSKIWDKNDFWTTFTFFFDEAVKQTQDVGEIRVYATDYKASDVIDIFGHYKPIKTRPMADKLNRNHIINMLMNNQVSSYLKGHYTDDYSRDAESNYSAGVAQNYPVAVQVKNDDIKGLYFGYDDSDPNKIRLSTIYGMYVYTLTITDPKLMIV